MSLTNPNRSIVRTARIAGAVAAVSAALLMSPVRADCFPWSIDMFRGPEVQPYAMAPRVTPADTLPVHGGEPPMSLEEAAIALHNPLRATPENLAAGKEQFNTYCAPCHGENGRGGGPAAHIGPVASTNLAAGVSKDRPDGYLYGAIRGGVRATHSSAQELPPRQRWQVVLYVRSLQAAATAANRAAGRQGPAASLQ